MRICILHLSDIHFRKSSNPIASRIKEITQAILSSDTQFKVCIVLVSGDVAYSGIEEEYDRAIDFLNDLRDSLSAARSELTIRFVTIPGNHDCYLPSSELGLRELLVKGMIPLFSKPSPDSAILDQLLRAQDNYWKFECKLGISDGSASLCKSIYIDFEGKTIRFNLFNTASLSQRTEQQGSLHVPIVQVSEMSNIAPDISLSISILHHSYLWIESNVAMQFRREIERMSDIVLMGHQHYPHSFYKLNSTGEAVVYVEGGALQEEHMPSFSSFSVLLFDFDLIEQCTLSFRWHHDIYKLKENSGWRPIQLNRHVRYKFEVTPNFQEFLNNPGENYSHSYKPNIRLSDIFIYPALRVRKADGKSQVRDLTNDQTFDFITKAEKTVIQSPHRGGKTALAKILFQDLSSKTNIIPLFLQADQITSPQENKLHALFARAFEEQYYATMSDNFHQLDKDDRALLVDDWHLVELNTAGRKAVVEVAAAYFGKIIFFADAFFQVHELANPTESVLFHFDHVEIRAFGPVLRGKLIDRWIGLGREHTLSDDALHHETEDLERLLRDVLGKNALPSLPFIIICVLQAHQANKITSPEEGSFGYLYEVLVTGALNKTTSGKSQLDKKYTFLSRLAYGMFKDDQLTKSAADVRTIAEKYSVSHMVNIDIDVMLNDLIFAHVLEDRHGNYSFCYPHLYYYFIARYYRDNIQGVYGSELLQEIKNMIDLISSDKNQAVLTFIMYFIRDNKDILDYLVWSATKILQDVAPATFAPETDSLDELFDNKTKDFSTEYDVRKNRQERREHLEEIERADDTTIDIDDINSQDYRYSDNLPDSKKFILAARYITLFGHLIRNSPGHLPGIDKVRVLSTVYGIGLRAINAVLQLLKRTSQLYRETIIESSKKDAVGSKDEIIAAHDEGQEFIGFLARLLGLGTIKMVSMSIGVADLEKAYGAVLTEIGDTNATRLIDLSIRLDHFNEIPVPTIQKLHKRFGPTSFADIVLMDMIAYHFSIFDADRSVIQRVAAIFRSNTGRKLDTQQLLNARHSN